MELWQLYVSEPPSTKSLWAVWDAPIHLSSEESAPGWQWSWAPIRRKGNRGDLHLSSLFISDSIGGGGMHCSCLCSLQEKWGRFFSLLNSLQSERQKGILETGKGFSPERMYTEKSRALLWDPVVEVTAEWPLFYKLELGIIVWHITVYADKLWIPIADLPGHSSLKNKAPPLFPMLFPIASSWRGQGKALRIWWAGVGGKIIGYL